MFCFDLSTNRSRGEGLKLFNYSIDVLRRAAESETTVITYQVGWLFWNTKTPFIYLML